MTHAFRRRLRLAPLGVALSVLAFAGTGRASDRPGADNAPAAPPSAIALLRSQPVSMTGLGDTGGVRGYLLRTRDGRTQTIYIWPNGRDFIYGTMFAGNGHDLTRTQLADIGEHSTPAADPSRDPTTGVETDPKSAAVGDIPALAAARHAGDKIIRLAPSGPGAPAGFRLVNGRLRQIVYVTPDGLDLIAGEHAAVERDAKGVVKVVAVHEPPMPRPSPAVSLPLPPPPPPAMVAPKTVVPPSPPPTIASIRAAAAKGAGTRDSRPLDASPAAAGATRKVAGKTPERRPRPAHDGIDGPVPPQQDVSQQVFQDNIAKAAWFRIGDATATTVWFVADPAAPLTRAAWKVLDPLVKHHEIALRVIPVDGSMKSERLNMGIMTAPHPGQAWRDVMDGQGIDVPRSGSKAYRNASDWLNDNWVFAHAIGVTGTPFIAYEGSDKMFHSAQEPASVTLFMSGL